MIVAGIEVYCISYKFLRELNYDYRRLASLIRKSNERYRVSWSIRMDWFLKSENNVCNLKQAFQTTLRAGKGVPALKQ
jgi:hypothetical protein